MAGLNFEYSTFSGADILASVTVPLLTNDPANGKNIVISKPITIGNIQTISISTERQKAQVWSLGRANSKGTTRGTRMIAGSLIFTMFDRESMSQVQEQVREFYQGAHINYSAYYGNVAVPNLIPNFKADELPPFDITITMANESGNAASMKLFGVELVSNGQVMGINELYLEEEMRYFAQDIQPLSPGYFGDAIVSVPFGVS